MKGDYTSNDIHNMPPVDTVYVAGRWHRDRVAIGGYVVEAKVFLKSLAMPRIKNRRFLVLSRARSGSTLLTRMLNEHSAVKCDGEVLKRNVLAPAVYLDRLARKSQTDVYGAKILSYQMVQVHRIKDTKAFSQRMQHQGFSFIHLVRNTFFQTLSLTIAHHRNMYHSDKGALAFENCIRLDPDEFCQRIAWNEALLEYERNIIKDVKHISVDYDQDLANSPSRNITLNRIFNFLKIPSQNIESSLEKILPADPKKIVENYGEIKRTLHINGFGHLIPSAL